MELIIEILVKILTFIFKAVFYIVAGAFGIVVTALLLAVDVIQWLILEGPIVLWTFLDKYIFIILALACWGAAIYVFIFYKPHPAAKFIKSYKKGKISRGEAIKKIADTMYDPSRDKIPAAFQTKILEKRISALRQRVRAETGLMEDAIKYIKTKSMMD